MKTPSILMSSFAALLILISVNENALKSTDILSKPDQTETKVQQMAVINDASSATYAPPVSKTTNNFNYLKFNVSDFETTEDSNYEMPYEADYSFLKFNVSDYIDTETEIGALPENSRFDYLKFDVNDYITSPSAVEELPSTDFDYLKFDVQKYMQNDSAGKINELPQADNL